MRGTHVFGFGSLVNRATTVAEGERAELPGWHRTWVHGDGAHAFLSITPADGKILGLCAPIDDWDALCAREVAYDPLDASAATLIGGGSVPSSTVVWRTRHPAPASADHPILRSYLDTVLQGYLIEFGEDGPAHFMATTTGWAPILDDRAAPIYPRATALSDTERSLFDGLIAALE